MYMTKYWTRPVFTKTIIQGFKLQIYFQRFFLLYDLLFDLREEFLLNRRNILKSAESTDNFF